MFASIIHSKDLSNLQMSVHLLVQEAGRRAGSRREGVRGCNSWLGLCGKHLTLCWAERRHSVKATLKKPALSVSGEDRTRDKIVPGDCKKHHNTPKKNRFFFSIHQLLNTANQICYQMKVVRCAVPSLGNPGIPSKP